MHIGGGGWVGGGGGGVISELLISNHGPNALIEHFGEGGTGRRNDTVATRMGVFRKERSSQGPFLAS